jgi:hypothetical protein
MFDSSFPELTKKKDIIAKWNNIQQAEYDAWYAELCELVELIEHFDNAISDEKDTLRLRELQLVLQQLKWKCTNHYQIRDTLLINRRGRANCMTTVEFEQMTPYQKFDIDRIPAWLNPLFKIGSNDRAGTLKKLKKNVYIDFIY